MQDEAIRVAQVGCGYWGKNLVRNYAEIGALGAVVDAHPETASRMAAEFSVPALTFDQALADPALKGLSFATPAAEHASGAIAALQAGKHVFVEKPLALTVEEGRRMISAALAADRVLMIGHLLQYHPIFATLRNMVSTGAIGDLHYIYSNRLSLGKFRTEEDVLWSFAPHDLSMILALTGERRVELVSARGKSFATPGIDDISTLQLQFEGGLAGHVFTSWAHPFKEQRLVCIGSTGMAVFEDSQPDWSRKLAIYRHEIDTSGPVPIPNASLAEYIDVPRSEPLKTECQRFVDAIAGRQPTLTDGEEGLRVLDVLERATRSLEGTGDVY